MDMPMFRCWYLQYPYMFEVEEMRLHKKIPNHFYETEQSVSVKNPEDGHLLHLGISEVILMQSTSFVDIDKKPIYADDIVETCPTWRIDNDFCAVKSNTPFVPEVGIIGRWGGDWAITERYMHQICRPSLIRKLSDAPGNLSTYVKVIGNKWEHPHLLKLKVAPGADLTKPFSQEERDEDEKLRALMVKRSEEQWELMLSLQ